MKKKVILISAFLVCIACVTVTLSFTKAQPPRPRKIVFLIGDGMGLAQISGAMSEYKGQNAFERFKVIGLSKTSSSDDYVTDSGAGATAFSIGKKTFNGAIGVGPDRKPEENLFEKLKKKEKPFATGVVVTSSVTHATPGSFYAHVADRDDEEAIAADFLKASCDIAIGGGYRFFMERKDKRELFKELNRMGYTTVADTTDGFKPQTASRLLYTLGKNELKSIQKGRGNYLTEATLNAMNLLGKNPNGYMLMVEGSQIDWGGHAMDYEYMKSELHDFNKTINAVLDEAQKTGDILVVVTADHETGGLVLALNKDKPKEFSPKYTYNKHTGIMVPVFAYGPGAEMFGGVYDNNTIFDKFVQLLNLK